MIADRFKRNVGPVMVNGGCSVRSKCYDVIGAAIDDLVSAAKVVGDPHETGYDNLHNGKPPRYGDWSEAHGVVRATALLSRIILLEAGYLS